jgi:hypothetical protein
VPGFSLFPGFSAWFKKSRFWVTGAWGCVAA